MAIGNSEFTLAVAAVCEVVPFGPEGFTDREEARGLWTLDAQKYTHRKSLSRLHTPKCAPCLIPRVAHLGSTSVGAES